MSLTIQTRITGDKIVQAKLKELARKSPIELKRALTESVLVVEKRAKFRVARQSSRLAALITHSVEKGASGEGFVGKVGTNVKYAPFIEFGTGKFATKPGGRKTPWVYYSNKLKRFVWTEGMASQPFLIPAFKESGRDIIKFIRAAFKRLEKGI